MRQKTNDMNNTFGQYVEHIMKQRHNQFWIRASWNNQFCRHI